MKLIFLKNSCVWNAVAQTSVNKHTSCFFLIYAEKYLPSAHRMLVYAVGNMLSPNTFFSKYKMAGT